MIEIMLMMMAFLYGAFFSMKFLWLFPLALVVFSIRTYLRKDKKNRK